MHQIPPKEKTQTKIIMRYYVINYNQNTFDEQKISWVEIVIRSGLMSVFYYLLYGLKNVIFVGICYPCLKDTSH